ncbi:MAG: hypothetical protein ABIR26_03195 [Ramlibacter sp.]
MTSAASAAKPTAATAQQRDRRPLADQLRDFELRFDAILPSNDAEAIYAVVEEACAKIRKFHEAHLRTANNSVNIGLALNQIALRNPIYTASLRIHIADNTSDDDQMYFRRSALGGGAKSETIRSLPAIAKAWIDSLPFDNPPTRDQLTALLMTPGNAGTKSTQSRVKEVLSKLDALQAESKDQQAFRDEIDSILRSRVHLSSDYIASMLEWVLLPPWLWQLIDAHARPGKAEPLVASATFAAPAHLQPQAPPLQPQPVASATVRPAAWWVPDQEGYGQAPSVNATSTLRTDSDGGADENPYAFDELGIDDLSAIYSFGPSLTDESGMLPTDAMLRSASWQDWDPADLLQSPPRENATSTLPAKPSVPSGVGPGVQSPRANATPTTPDDSYDLPDFPPNSPDAQVIPAMQPKSQPARSQAGVPGDSKPAAQPSADVTRSQWHSYLPGSAAFAPLAEGRGQRSAGQTAHMSGAMVAKTAHSERQTDPGAIDEAIRHFPRLRASDVDDVRRSLDQHKSRQFSASLSARRLNWDQEKVVQAIAAMLIAKARDLHHMDLNNSNCNHPTLLTMICSELSCTMQEARPFIANELARQLPRPGQ